MQINKKYGYIRVSSKSQESNSSIKYQKEQLIQNGIQPENIRIEVGSATNEIKNRLVFQKLIQEELKSNDLLMVTKIDRCSRNTLEFLKLQDILFKKNITFVALDLPTSIDLATNKLIATTLSGIAEFENNRRKERQKQGIRAAQQEGKYTGRKSIINQTLIQKVKNLKENKNLSVTEIAKVLGISRPTIYKILKQELNYVPYNRLVKATKGETNEIQNKLSFESEIFIFSS
jgi:DNA invertase Pin-like site-specific DNA recombinase